MQLSGLRSVKTEVLTHVVPKIWSMRSTLHLVAYRISSSAWHFRCIRHHHHFVAFGVAQAVSSLSFMCLMTPLNLVFDPKTVF